MPPCLLVAAAVALAVSPPPDRTLSGAAMDRIGYAGLAVGDFDADGHDDLVAASDPGGRIEVFLGSPAGLARAPSWVVVVPDADEVRVLDGDGDGRDDLFVADVFGRMYVYAGASALIGLPQWRATVADFAGAEAGDLDGDGDDDLAVLAPSTLFGGAGPNQVFVYLGGPGGLDPNPTQTLGGGPSWGWSGAVTDLDGDGLDDLVVRDNVAGGVLEVHAGGPGGVSAIATAAIPSWLPPTRSVGLLVLRGGEDLDGDGAEDLVTSARYTAPTTGIGLELLWGGPAPAPATLVGGPVLAAPDVELVPDRNGDGAAELLVGDPDLDPGPVDAGGAVVVAGAGGRALGPAAFRVVGTAQNEACGAQVALGDFDGNGRADLATACGGTNVVHVHVDVL